MTANALECVERFYPNGGLREREFLLDGELHRTDDPSCERWTSEGYLETRVFYTHGLLHRTDGPAVEWWTKQGVCILHAFHVNDERMSEKDFLAWQRQQRQRELRALVFALEHKFPAEAPEREFLRRILPAFVAGEAAT